MTAPIYRKLREYIIYDGAFHYKELFRAWLLIYYRQIQDHIPTT